MDKHGVEWEPEIAVDLDGTLAHYDGWKGIKHIGEPIPLMMNRVVEWIAEGKKVTIFTARVSGKDGYLASSYIKKWLADNGLPSLGITSTKRKQFIEIWDDRCIQIIPNTGERFK